MTTLIKPIAVALKGKGLSTVLKRIWSISSRYGLNTAKMDQSLNQLSHLLQEFDCRATFPVTTLALVRNSDIIRKYQGRYIEFAIHGYRHIDHSQLSAAEQEEQFLKAKKLFREQDIHYQGFRCPYLRWNEGTLVALSNVDLVYDSSSSLVWPVDDRHTTDSYHRVLEFYGTQSATEYLSLPSFDTAKNLVRIPYSLPDDESLIERLVWDSPAEMNAIWPAMFHQIHSQGEFFNLGLHPERTTECAVSLKATLQAVQAVASEVWRARLDEIAQWWVARYNTKIEMTQPDNDTLCLNIKGPEGITVLLRSLDIKTPTTPWFDTYHRATELPCLITTKKRPFIGVSPHSSPSLISFLRQQGYIVEKSTEPNSYTFYLDRPTFSAEEQKPLVEDIESASFPLARLGRWPEGRRSAFCITGDIDALTIWDYGLRFLGH